MTTTPAAPVVAPDLQSGGHDEASPGLWKNRDFKVILAGQSVSALGDAISITTMPLLVLALTGSGALMGIVAALQLLPDLVLGLPAGAIADRWDRRRMMLWADAGRALLTASIPISFWLGWPTMTVILIVTIPINTLRLFSDAGFTSAVPSLVGRQHLGRANGYLEAALSGSFVIGPAAAGALVVTIGAPSTLALDALSFALSAVSLSLVRRPLRADRSGERPDIVADIKEGIRFVVRRPVLRAIIAFWGVVGITTAALIPVLGYYLIVDRGETAALFGFVGSAWSAGYLVGSLVAGRLGPERVGRRMIGCGVAIGASLIAIGSSGEPLGYIVAASVIGFALSVLLVSYLTLRASVTPDRLLGRVGSTARTITLGLQPLGLVVGGAALDASGGGTTLLAMGAVTILASLLFAVSRTFRDARHGFEMGPDASPIGA